jgi:CDP-glucose 4,6-dehydratase
MESMVDYLEFFRDKKVFITGHTGFKGSWMSLWLTKLGAKVKGYSLAPVYCNSLFELSDLGLKIDESVIGDILNYEKLYKSVSDFSPDIIFHLAAQPLVKYSYSNPIETFQVNIQGTINILEVVRTIKKPCILILITTDKVYDNKETIFPYRECDPLGGHDPYSSSKACAEIISQSFLKSFFNPKFYNDHGVKLSTARAGNVIGGGDWSADRLVPDIVRAFKNDENLIIRYPNSVRPWQHVLEPIHGYLKLAHYLSITDPNKLNTSFNFGPHILDNLKVIDFVKQAQEFLGSGSYEIDSSFEKVHEAGLLKLDISRAIDIINWYPLLNSKIAIENTMLWYQSFYNDKSKISEFTLNQINEFEQKINL